MYLFAPVLNIYFCHWFSFLAAVFLVVLAAVVLVVVLVVVFLAAAVFRVVVFSAAFVSTEAFASSVFGVSALTAFSSDAVTTDFAGVSLTEAVFTVVFGCSFLCSSHVYSLLTRDLLIFSRILGYHFL